MQRISIKHGLATAGIALLAIGSVPVLAIGANSHASAQAGSANTTTTTGSAGNGGQSSGSGSSQAASHQAAAQTRLAAAQLKACQNRQNAITNVMARISDRGQKQLDLFTTIATRVETFYTAKGKTLSNYDALVADVNAKQAAAQAVVSSTDTSGSGFSCSSTDPKGFVNSFMGSLKSEISALQAYRISVKNLIVGVQSVEGTTSSTTNKTNSGGNQ